MYQIEHFELATTRPVALRLRAGSVIRNTSGHLWITMVGQPDDVWLQAGESWTLTLPGTVWVSAESAATFQVAQLAAQRSVGWISVRSLLLRLPNRYSRTRIRLDPTTSSQLLA